MYESVAPTNIEQMWSNEVKCIKCISTNTLKNFKHTNEMPALKRINEKSINSWEK